MFLNFNNELFSKYKETYGKNSEPPERSFIKKSYEIEYDEYAGIFGLARYIFYIFF